MRKSANDQNGVPLKRIHGVMLLNRVHSSEMRESPQIEPMVAGKTHTVDSSN